MAWKTVSYILQLLKIHQLVFSHVFVSFPPESIDDEESPYSVEVLCFVSSATSACGDRRFVQFRNSMKFQGTHCHLQIAADSSTSISTSMVGFQQRGGRGGSGGFRGRGGGGGGFRGGRGGYQQQQGPPDSVIGTLTIILHIFIIQRLGPSCTHAKVTWW